VEFILKTRRYDIVELPRGKSLLNHLISEMEKGKNRYQIPVTMFKMLNKITIISIFSAELVHLTKAAPRHLAAGSGTRDHRRHLDDGWICEDVQ